VLLNPAQPVIPVPAQESFHVVSGMYPLAEAGTGGAVEVFAAFQNVVWLFASSKSVPPMATLNGVDASPLTATPPDAALAGLSQAADPLSPAEITTVIPSAAACCHRAL
jgi:hypothetical protein